MSARDHFSKWLGEIDPTISAEQIKSRWSGVEELADSDAKQLISLAGVYAGLRRAETSEAIYTVMKAHDETFPYQENEHLVRIMAGSVLWWAFEEEYETAIGACLAVRVLFGPLRDDEGPLEGFVAHATAFSDGLARTARRSLGSPPRLRSAPSKKADGELDTAAVLKQAEAGTRALRESTGKAMRSLFDAVDQRMSSLQEELDILWWVFGMRMESDIRVSPGEAATKLTARTSGELPHPGAGAFLRAMTTKTPPLPVTELVDELIARGMDEMVESSAGMRPVSDMLSIAQQSAEGHDWSASCANLPVEASLSKHEFALQLHCEQLLLRFENPS